MNAIFVFTKDRPATLKNTLACLQSADYSLFLVDDSCEQNNRKVNRLLLEKTNAGMYFGNDEFQDFFKKININLCQYPFLFESLGKSNWNLGACRNFALLFARVCGYDKVLFIDDDITFTSTDLIDRMFSNLESVHFSGSKVVGLEDHSLVGYIAQEVKSAENGFLSGGFLAFKPSRISHYFFNIYNEDWIWMLLNSPAKNIMSTGFVTQSWRDQFENFAEKILLQEIGDIIGDGLLEYLAENPVSANELCNHIVNGEFWGGVIHRRKLYLEKLKVQAQNKRHFSALNNLLLQYDLFSPIQIVQIFSNYFFNIESFRDLYNNVQISPTDINHLPKELVVEYSHFGYRH